MTYTLVSAPAVGFDLSRLPGGTQVAVLLRTALTADAETLARLAAQHPGDARRAEWAALQAVLPDEVGVVETIPRAGEALVRAGQGDAELLRRLERSLLGSTRALDRFVRHELLDWTWLGSSTLAVQDPVASQAADVVVDAAVAAYRRDLMDPAVRRAMAVPVLRAGVPLRDRDTAVGLPVLDAALTDLAAADGAVRDRWRLTTDALRPRTAEWAPAMHRATWALSVTERLRLAADAQLAAVAAFRDAGFTARDAAYGVWNAVSGAVQAIVALDLLEDSDAETLLAAWQRVHGLPDVR